MIFSNHPLPQQSFTYPRSPTGHRLKICRAPFQKAAHLVVTCPTPDWHILFFQTWSLAETCVSASVRRDDFHVSVERPFSQGLIDVPPFPHYFMRRGRAEGSLMTTTACTHLMENRLVPPFPRKGSQSCLHPPNIVLARCASGCCIFPCCCERDRCHLPTDVMILGIFLSSFLVQRFKPPFFPLRHPCTPFCGHALLTSSFSDAYNQA